MFRRREGGKTYNPPIYSEIGVPSTGLASKEADWDRTKVSSS